MTGFKPWTSEPQPVPQLYIFISFFYFVLESVAAKLAPNNKFVNANDQNKHFLFLNKVQHLVRPWQKYALKS